MTNNISDKFQIPLKCICNNDVIFEIIDDVECDWGLILLYNVQIVKNSFQ